MAVFTGEKMNLEEMQRELDRLRAEAAGFEAQSKLLENFIDVAPLVGRRPVIEEHPP